MRMTRPGAMELMVEKVVLKAIEAIVVTGNVSLMKEIILIWFVK